ncbi:MAG: response regulator, partial [Desulfovibrionaceae bacterium]|nr:response regulator [Desulfovibrionaceae bacterium]
PIFAQNVVDEYRRICQRKQQREGEVVKADLGGRKVLLAEDIPLNAEIIIQILALLEVEVDHAENGQIVVEMFEKSEVGYYDAILMDLRMPVLDGLGASKAIRALERKDAKLIPIISVTANAFDEDVQKSMQAGMNAHLTKPVEPGYLEETLAYFIGKYDAEGHGRS